MSEQRVVWMDLPQEEHEFQFNPQRAFPDFKDVQEKRAAANAKARTSLASHLDLPYGEHKLRRLDIFRSMSAERAAPVHVFVHGGYWRAQDKENFAFVATELVRRGIITVVINYELCPSSTLDLVADSALAAIEWVSLYIAEYGGDPRRISLLGHSAGAHLCAVGLAADWRARGIDPSFIRGAVLVSGIFDPAPAMHTTVNADLRLTPEIVARHDVERRVLTVDCPVFVLAGGLEPWMWIDQSFRYSHHLRRQGRDPGVLVQPGYTHFDIVDQYLDAESPLLRAVLRMAAR
jgi:arylformamidase